MTAKQIANALGFKTGYTIENGRVVVTIDTEYGVQKHVVGYDAFHGGLYYKTNTWNHSHNGRYIMTAGIVKTKLYKAVIDKTK